MVATQQSPWWQKTTGGAYPTATPSLAWNPYRDAQQQAVQQGGQPQAQMQPASLPSYAGTTGPAQPGGTWWQNQSAPNLAGQPQGQTGAGYTSGGGGQQYMKLAGTGAVDGASTAASGVAAPAGTGGASNQSLAGGPPPTSPTGLTNGNPNNNGVTGGNDPQWYDHLPEFTRGGGYPVGYEYNQQTKTWTPKGPQAAGTLIGHEVGWKTPLYLPSVYDPRSDNSSFEASTGAEKALARAIRKTADFARGNPQGNAQHYFEYLLANLTRDAAKQGQSSGFNAAQFNPATQTDAAYGSAYDPNMTYMAQGVSNPYTGKPAGNAQGQSTAVAGPVGVPGTGGQGGGGGGQGNTVPTTPGGKGQYDPLAIKNAESDQRLGYDMLHQYLTGSTDEGTGPFSGFLEDFLGPIATALINAKGAGGQTPTNIDDIFAAIKSGVGPGATTNLYDYMGGMARNAMKKQLGGGDVSFNEASQVASMYSPLLTRGFNPIAQKQYSRQLGNQLRGMQAPSYRDMLGNDKGDYGGALAKSQFYHNWWDR